MYSISGHIPHWHMKRLVLQREPSTDEGTFSVGTFDGDLQWQFIELPWRDNKPNLSCVPAGLYTARIVQSAHFGRAVYLIENVPGRDAIEMHNGNFAGDITKGFQSDLRGCCSPGGKRDYLINKYGIPQKAVLDSRLALDQIIEATGGEPIEIEFIDP